jgi:hypothetical protein
VNNPLLIFLKEKHFRVRLVLLHRCFYLKNIKSGLFTES